MREYWAWRDDGGLLKCRRCKRTDKGHNIDKCRIVDFINIILDNPYGTGAQQDIPVVDWQVIFKVDQTGQESCWGNFNADFCGPKPGNFGGGIRG